MPKKKEAVKKPAKKVSTDTKRKEILKAAKPKRHNHPGGHNTISSNK